MIPAVPPPTAAESAYHAKAWNHVPHRDLCVRMTNGHVVVPTEFASYPDYDVWGSEESAFLSHPDHYGRIWIESSGGPPYTGRVCLSIRTSPLVIDQ